MNKLPLILISTFISLICTGCNFADNIFRTGIWTGIIIIIAIAAVTAYIVKLFIK